MTYEPPFFRKRQKRYIHLWNFQSKRWPHLCFFSFKTWFSIGKMMYIIFEKAFWKMRKKVMWPLKILSRKVMWPLQNQRWPHLWSMKNIGGGKNPWMRLIRKATHKWKSWKFFSQTRSQRILIGFEWLLYEKASNLTDLKGCKIIFLISIDLTHLWYPECSTCKFPQNRTGLHFFFGKCWKSSPTCFRWKIGY